MTEERALEICGLIQKKNHGIADDAMKALFNYIRGEEFKCVKPLWIDVWGQFLFQRLHKLQEDEMISKHEIRFLAKEWTSLEKFVRENNYPAKEA